MTKAQILIVEDNRIIAEDIKMSLEHLGFGVLAIVPSGNEAIIRAKEEGPDLVLMDIVLEGKMNGTEAAEHILTQYNIPVVYLTAYADEKQLERAKVTEPYGYIIKPFEDRELNVAIEIALYKHKMEKKLKESKEWLSTTLNSIGDAVIATDIEGHVIFMNPVAESLTGWNQKEAIGKPLEDVFKIINEETRKEVENPVTRVLRENGVVGLANHTILISKNGSEYAIADSGSPIRNDQGDIVGVVLIFQDASEKRRAEKALQVSEEKYRGLFDESIAATYVFDKKKKFIDSNQAGFDLLGYSRKELLSMSITDVDADPTVVLPAHKQFLGGERIINYEHQLKRKDGRIVTVLNNSRPLTDAQGSVVGMQSTLIDITERKRHEQILAARLRLSEFSTTHSVDELLQRFLDEAEKLTGSNIGFFHFLQPDQKTLSLQMWSTNTLERMCNAEGKDLHYPISEAGVWTDAIRDRHAVIHNDYKSLPHCKGLPEGHAPVIRELVVPVFREDKIVAVLGVGNKESDYVEEDVRTVADIADMAWDIVLRKQAEEKLRNNERFLNAIVENIPNMIFVKDAQEHRFVRLNKASEDLLGYSREELIGKNDYDFFPKEEADFFTKKDREVLNSGTFLDIPEEPIHTKYQGDRILHTKKIPILDEKGQPEYLLGISEDITERKRLEEQLRQAQKMESIGTLAGGIAHDFNNILFPIVGLSEMLLEDFPPESLEYENAQEIFKAGKRGSDLVKQILAFSRQSERKMIPVRIQQILKEVLQLGRSTIPANVEIDHEIQNDCGLVMADPTQLQQVAMNLITNAYHALEKTGGKISVQLKETDVRQNDPLTISLQPGQYAILSVSDTGYGIDPAILNKIFEPYFTTKKKGKGTGLGLSLVYGIVKEHRGDIKVDSTVGTGTTFKVYIPLMEKTFQTATFEEAQSYQTGNERILLVDDEGAIVQLEKQMLERLGYNVISYISSIDALDAFKANPEAFDLVVTDMTMPNMTGDQLAKELMSIKPGIPVIICTGYSEMINPEKAAAMGIRGLLMKPIIKSEMAQMIRKVLDKKQ